jgi:riboflavin kinase/FMN adenylyltransferase
MILTWLDNREPQIDVDTALAVGNFDGVHTGHQDLVRHVIQVARRGALLAGAITFDPHPARVVSPTAIPPPLMSLAQKAEALAALGLDRLFVMRFTRETALMSPFEFATLVLRGRLRARVVTVGERFRFGSSRAGDARVLEDLGRAHEFAVHRLPDVIHDGVVVSSTRIRELVMGGDVERAGRLLGRRHFSDGVVVRGRGRGRRLGFATANLQTPQELVPGNGVYAAWCRIRDKAGELRGPLQAVVNIGRSPTFGDAPTTIEAHLLDFEEVLYGRPLRIEYHARLRDERAFDNEECLRSQIRLDRSSAERILENGP